MDKKQKYIYGVIKANQPVRFNWPENQLEIFTICYQDLAVVLSDRLFTDYSALPKSELIRELAAHQAIVEEIMKETTIVPFKFGTYVRDDAEVISALRKGYGKLSRELAAIEGKIEIELVVLWNMSRAVNDIYLKNQKIQELQKKIASKPVGESFEDRIALGKMVTSTLMEMRSWYAEKIGAEMQKHTQQLKENTILDETMVINLALLLERNDEDKLEEAIHRLDKEFNSMLNFKCVGPLPAYSFSTLEVKRISRLEIEKARDVLGIGQQAKQSEIKQAYRKLIQKYHPDSHGGGFEAEDRFRQINEAYVLLAEHSQDSQDCSDNVLAENGHLLIVPASTASHIHLRFT